MGLKQLFIDVIWNSYSEKFFSSHRKAPALNLFFNGQQPYKKKIHRRCFPSICGIFQNIFFEEHLEETAFNPFRVTGLFLNPLKTSENQRFSGGIERDQWYEMV